MDLSTAILVVDDDAGIREVAVEYLTMNGFIAGGAANGIEMNECLAQKKWDLIVLDIMMPGCDGLTILQDLMKRGGPPVIIQSGLGSDTDKIVGLEMGADDYLPKPVNPRELLARIRSVLRRSARGIKALEGGNEKTKTMSDPLEEGSKYIYKFAGWSVDLMSRIVYDPDQTMIMLSDSEFRLLRTFIERPRRVLSRDQLLDIAHGMENDSYDRAIDVQISRLRRKMDHNGEYDLIRTIRSEGYMFVHDVTRKIVQKESPIL